MANAVLTTLGLLWDTTKIGTCVGVVGMILYSLFAWISNVTRLSRFPGPRALPLFGNLYDVRAFQTMKYLTVMRRKFGKIFTFFAGNQAMLVLMDNAAVRQVLTDTRTFVKGSDYTNKFSVGFGDGLVTSNGQLHKHDRSCLGKFFVRTNVEKHLRMICQTTSQMMREALDPKASDAAGGGESVNMESYFMFVTLRVFGKFAISYDYSEEGEHRRWGEWVCKWVSYGSHVIGEQIILGLPMWNILPKVRKLRWVVEQLDVHFNAIIDTRIAARARGEEDEQEDCVSAMLDDKQDRTHMLAQLRTLVCAGHDTTAFFGCYMSLLLAKHPEVQDKVKAEVRRVLGGRTDLTSEDIEQLPYCRMVMQETLRLYAVIPFVNRMTSVDTQLKADGRTIPAGTTVLVPLGLMNRDPDVWDEPSAFRPERFEGMAGLNSAKSGYLPFGYGSRTCIGNSLALTEGICMIALLMQRYRFIEDTTHKPKLAAGISLVSENGIHVRLQREAGAPETAGM